MRFSLYLHKSTTLLFIKETTAGYCAEKCLQCHQVDLTLKEEEDLLPLFCRNPNNIMDLLCLINEPPVPSGRGRNRSAQNKKCSQLEILVLQSAKK
ncbi:hypothetical protein RR48_04089 [Papilio machaon]|uniref:Uncharacterized protein n=1 Tax=Papilio machaon TaxID=76193 RepID=A0A0N1IQ46_PAPMA|nr:hypothetical protein RR48_04089 [Papilio machaon]